MASTSSSTGYAHDMMATSGNCLRTLSFDIPVHTLLQSIIPQRLSDPFKCYEVVVITTFHATKRLLTRAAQPIDASRGVIIVPSVLVVTNPTMTRTHSEQLMYNTPSFLITSPIPDASMPYNVITLVSYATLLYYDDE